MEAKTMKIGLYTICAVIALCVASCTDSASRHHRQVNEAEQLMQTNADSAMVILDNIDPSYLKVDSIKAKYHYLRAFGHMRQKPLSDKRLANRVCPSLL